MASPNIILVFGADDFMVAEKAKELIDALVPAEERSFGLEIIDCAVDTVDNAKAAIYAAQNALMQEGFMFGGGKTVWMKNITFCGTDRTSKSEFVKAVLDDFKAFLLKGLPADFTLLMSSASLTKVSGFYKALAKLDKDGKAKIHELAAPSGRDAVTIATQIIDEHLKSIGAEFSMPYAVRTAFLERCGTLPRVVIAELDKLVLFTGGKEPALADIEKIVTLNHGGEPWDLTDAFGEHNLAKTINVLHNLYEMRTEPIFLVLQLQTRVNELLLIRDALDRKQLSGASLNWSSALSDDDKDAVAGLGKFDIASKNPWQGSRLIAQANKWKRINLRKARMILITAHERMVSVSVNPKSVLEIAVIEALG